MVKSVRRLTRTKTALSLAIIAAGMGMGPLAASAPAFAAAKAGGTVITTREGPFGTMLVVGSGKFAGYTLYLFTGDSPRCLRVHGDDRQEPPSRAGLVHRDLERQDSGVAGHNHDRRPRGRGRCVPKPPRLGDAPGDR